MQKMTKEWKENGYQNSSGSCKLCKTIFNPDLFFFNQNMRMSSKKPENNKQQKVNKNVFLKDTSSEQELERRWDGECWDLEGCTFFLFV